MEIPADFGYILFVIAGVVLLNAWQMLRIGRLRKKLGVEYPIMVSDKFPVFNCYQRCHQNTLENMPFFLATLVGGGLVYPFWSTMCGVVWIVGRIIYTLGYSTGKPKYRFPGFILSSIIAQLCLLGLTITSGVKILGY